MDASEKDFIGTGWKFPVEFNKDSKEVELLEGDTDIRNSLDILFKTAAGERVMHPDYGSELSYFLFSSMNRGTLTYMENTIRKAILFNEPRIIVNEVKIEVNKTEQGRVDITIEYTIPSTNNRYNYVYPFYYNEATGLKR